MPTPHVRALFAEGKNPRHAPRGHVLPLHKQAADIAHAYQRQAAALRELIIAVELDPDTPDALRGKMELLHQKVGAMDTDAAVIAQLCRRMVTTVVNFERQIAEAEADVAEWQRTRKAHGDG